MKKFLLLLGTLLCAFNLSAQNYDGYLQRAYSALNEGKIEVAQSSYNVYKKLTGKTDSDFEILLKDKIDNDWTKSCHIIDLGNGEYLAVQKVDSYALKYDNAQQVCEANRLGGFTDWRLPSVEECITYFSQLKHTRISTTFWTRDKKDVRTDFGFEFRRKIITNHLKISEVPVCRQHENDGRIIYMDVSFKYLIVRRFRR